MNKKLGYYSIGKVDFESKIRACMFASSIISKLQKKIDPKSIVNWVFNDQVFENYSWSQEPEDSLDCLYDKRAKQLRDTYDYIVISYSGGADSHNMLMAFLRQDLFVDEIIVTHMNKAMNDYAIIDPSEKSAKYAYSSEYALQTIPRLKEISNLSPQTKIRIFDVSDSVFNAFARHKDESWVFHVKEELNPVDASRYNYLQFPEFKKQLDFSKKIAIILGVDKPKIEIDENSQTYYICFQDRLANISPVGEYAKDYTNTTIEYFYWSPDACDLLCKQAHTIVKWLKMNPGFKKFFLENPVITTDNRLVSERILRPLLYTTWNSSWFQADKGLFDWHSSFDSWFIERYKNTLEYLLWKKGLLYVTKTCAPYLANHYNPDSLMRFKKRYSL